MASREETLARCLSAMEAGQSVDGCITSFGSQAAELRPLLALASDIRSIPVPRARPEARAALEQKMLAALDTLPSGARARPRRLPRLPAFWLPRPALRWAAIMAAVLILVLGGGWASVTAADHSLPGDLLHPIKLAHEWVQISLTVDPASKQQLRDEFSRERLEETTDVLDRQRQAEVEFAGELTLVADDRWRIEGFWVYLNPDTVVLGEPILGNRIQVRALAPGDGTLLAKWLQVVQEANQLPDPNLESRPAVPSGAAPLPSPTNTATPPAQTTATATSARTSTPSPSATEQGESETSLRQHSGFPTPSTLWYPQRTASPQPAGLTAEPGPTGAVQERVRPERWATAASATPMHSSIERGTPKAGATQPRTPGRTPTATSQALRTRQNRSTPQPPPALTSAPEAQAATATPIQAREPEHTPQPSPEHTMEPEHTPEPTAQEKDPGPPSPSEPPRREQESQPPRQRSTRSP